MCIDGDQNIVVISKTQNQNGARDADRECPNGNDGQEGFSFTSFSTSKWTRNMKKTIDGKNG